jgi:hypothetical protein
MEATYATDEPTLAKPGPPCQGLRSTLLRERLFWASAAAFVGLAEGLAGTLSLAAWESDAASGGVTSGWPALVDVGYWVGNLAVLSLLGVPALLDERSRSRRIGTALLLAWLAVQLAMALAVPYTFSLYPSLWSPKGLLAVVLFLAWVVAIDLLGSAAFSVGCSRFALRGR